MTEHFFRNQLDAGKITMKQYLKLINMNKKPIKTEESERIALDTDTLGHELVRSNDNPSSDLNVQEVKDMFANIIDTIFEDDIVLDNNGNIVEESSVRHMYRNYAIMKSIEAQMWAIKFLTAKK